MQPSSFDHDAASTLTDRLVAFARDRIERRLWREGARIPSIRHMAATHGVSRFTVVAAYDRLADMGLIAARPGAGFFVQAAAPRGRVRGPRAVTPADQGIDVHWLLRNMHSHVAPQRAPGFGFLPEDWYAGDRIAAAIRAVGRAPGRALVRIGTPEGYAPLREWIADHLASLDVPAPAEQIVLTHGVTHAIDLIARVCLKPGDTVFVEDPAWFLMFGQFASAGARVIGVPRRADGPDLVALERLAAHYSPRLFVMSPVCHNPTGSVVSPQVAAGVLRIARAHDVVILEDDIYGDLAGPSAARLAALDRLDRVMYCGGFSKSLAPNVRVGYIAAAPAWAARLVEHKMLATMSTPEVNERVVLRLVDDRAYGRQLAALRGRVDEARALAKCAVERAGWRVPDAPASGLFVWADAGRDTMEIATHAQTQGIVCAPGALFSPTQRASTFMRLNVATCTSPEMARWLAAAVRRRR